VEKTFSFTNEELELFKTLQKAIRVLKDENQQFPVSHLDGLLEVALNPDLGSTEYAKRLETSKANGSRLLGYLGERSRRGQKPYKYIRQYNDAIDARKTHYCLTERGDKILKKLVKELSSCGRLEDVSPRFGREGMIFPYRE
jgi:DNA-binding MarR family transcriptional regulator